MWLVLPTVPARWLDFILQGLLRSSSAQRIGHWQLVVVLRDGDHFHDGYLETRTSCSSATPVLFGSVFI
jgi:hypothetical protein